MVKLLYIMKLIFVINLFLTSNLYANENNDTVSLEKQSYDEIVETLPYEYISFESSKKFIKSLKDILKDEIPNDKMDFTLKPFNVSDTGLNYKNIKTLKKALPLGSKEIIRSVKELNIEEGSELEKSLQKEIYQIALSLASGKSLNEIRKSSSKGKIGLGLLGVGAAIAVGGSSDSPAPVPSVSINTSTSTLAEDSSSNITVTATLNILQDTSTTINLTTSGTATVSSDYSISSETITIDAGDKTGSVTVSSIDNSLYEGNETVIIDISDVTGSNIVEAGVQRKTITITDSLAASTVTLSSSASSVAENESDLTLTATLNRQTFEDVTVTLTGTGTSTAGTDYASLSTITISAGNTTGTTTFNPTDDSVYEGSETAIIAITSVSGGDATESGTQSKTITITDNETAPTVTLSTSASSVAENGSDLTLTATLSGATSEDVTVTLTGTGTSTAGTDYASLSTITISAGSTTGTTAFNPTDDSVYEGSETAIIAITGVSGGSATESGTQSKTITITDNETAPTVTLSTSANSVAENGSDLTITATLSNIADVDVVVVLGTSGSATEGTHYATLSNITISAGSSTGTTSFNPTDDNILGGNKSAVIAISSLSGASATNGSPSSKTISIIDDEGTPTVSLSVSDTSVAENGSDLTLTATLSLATAEDVTVTLAGSGTSTAGTDYETLSTITISAGSTTGTTLFDLKDDTIYEGNETAIITITGVSGGSAIINGTQSKTITITDDDTAPSLSINDVTASDESAANHTFTVSLSAPSGKSVTVDYATSDGTATAAGSDYTAISATTLTIDAGETSKTFTVGVLTDSTDEADETVTLTLSNASNASISDATGTLTITDDDTAPSLSINDVSVAEVYNANTTATFTVSLSAPSGKTVTVNYATSNVTATAGADYTAISATTLTFAAGQTSKTFTVTILNDLSYESSETATLTLSSAGNASLSDATGTLTITDKALNSGYAPLTSSQEATANTTKASTEFTDIGANVWGNGYSSYYSSTNSFELINLDKAWAYGLTGAGTTVIVSDGEFDSDSTQLDSAVDKVTISGSITECSNTALSCHGAATAGLIAGDIGDSGNVGVAPNAKLILTNYDLESTTTALNSAPSSTVAINNSWGFNASLIDDEIALKTSNGWSSSELFANRIYGNTNSTNTAKVTNWVDAMDDFQDHGVIVFSNSNTSANDNAEITAALPEIFPELAEAFIAAVNIDVGGSISGGVAGPSGYRRWSAPCGDAAKYCLAGDGTVINVLNSGNRWSYGLYDADGNIANSPEQLTLGTSYVAPMISGAVALIAEAFPNQDPEDWVDRLLASADNSIGYTHIGYVEFGNGVKHGYSHDAGHGILDIYAALQPITSNSYTQMMHYGASLESQGQSYALNQTQMVAMQSIGDSLAKALEGEVTYFYDALDGGFAFDIGQTIRPSLSVVKPSISIDHEIGETKSLKYKKLSFTNSFSENKNRSGYLTFTESEGNSTLIGFASNGSWNGYNDASYVFPFLSDIQGGTGINFGNDFGNGYLTLSYNIEGQGGQNAISAKDSLTFGYKVSPIENVNIYYLLGFADENESFLGVKGTGAFDFEGADNKTTFLGFKSDIKLSNKQFVNFGFGLSDTVINTNNEGIIQSLSGLTADSFEIGFTTFDTFGPDMLSISISQPSRVSSGSAELKIAGLANSDGTIPYTYKNVSMEPSGRQLDFAITFNYELNNFSSLRIKMMMTNEKGHDEDVDKEESVFVGYSRSSLSGNQKFEIGATSSSSNETALKINYNLNW